MTVVREQRDGQNLKSNLWDRDLRKEEMNELYFRCERSKFGDVSHGDLGRWKESFSRIV